MTVPFEKSANLSALPGIVHGFFGRQGGVSAGDFASLNASDAGGDEPGVVAENRARIAAALGGGALTLLTQTHSAAVVVRLDSAGRPEADAQITDKPALLLGILTADCVPVLFADPQARIVGAAHAGWKGAVTGVVENTLHAMIAAGAESARIVAAIGPAISGANYEVGPDFAATMNGTYPKAARHIFMPPGGREHFDLPGFVGEQLKSFGIVNVERAGQCTYANEDRYFSHRRATHRGTRAGRQLSVIGLR